ncbi:hypothetical protein UFOVP254_33 [uncultured Caudovirales phage]|uniref:Uncharacterized protein n=1 Tax=uncultured Caudovirales phage TaxID=2100421 RepID=A0A6J5LG04_9CAUD|nr:hypothetical protein UFOVP76_20 [uncultured Caudovirales phage]CAB4133035.1 hypothetical protein UFOVP254_33 [uncultured Caudovirales phage]
MHIYLKHFLHGSKVAIAEQEAIADEENGWVRYNPEEPPEPTLEVTPEVKRGRPRKVVSELQ